MTSQQIVFAYLVRWTQISALDTLSGVAQIFLKNGSDIDIVKMNFEWSISLSNIGERGSILIVMGGEKRCISRYECKKFEIQDPFIDFGRKPSMILMNNIVVGSMYYSPRRMIERSRYFRWFAPRRDVIAGLPGFQNEKFESFIKFLNMSEADNLELCATCVFKRADRMAQGAIHSV